MHICRKQWLNKRFIAITCGICLVLFGFFYKGQQFYQFAVHLWQKVFFRVDAITGATRLAGSPVEITNKSTYDALTFDPKRKKYGVISYHLSKPAWVRIRIVRHDQKELVLRTLVDWSPRDEGKNIEHWDGKDSSGNLMDNKQCFVLFEADSEEHKKHDWKRCRELQIKITSPTKTESVVSGMYKFSAVVEKETGGYGDISGYNVRWYVDYKLLHQASYPKGSFGPFDFQWDFNKYGGGVHWVSILVDDYHDHVGSVSIKVLISPNGLLRKIQGAEQ